MRMVESYIKRKGLDVMFMQEAKMEEKETWQQLMGSQYKVVEGDAESIVIYKDSSFSVQRDAEFENKHKDALNFHKDSCFVKLGGYLLISAHLSSKSPVNEQ